MIEHVGTRERQKAFAEEVRRLAPAYFVQTPNLFFPIEPHYGVTLMQFLPRRMRRSLIRYFTVTGWLEKPTPKERDELVDSIRLLSRKEFESLFPDGTCEIEWFMGLAKSFSISRGAMIGPDMAVA